MSPTLPITLFLLLFWSGCGDSSSGTRNEDPVSADPGDSQPATNEGVDSENEQESGSTSIDITNAIFNNFDGYCGDYTDIYVSNVTDVQRGLAFSGSLSITRSPEGKCVFATNAIPNHDFNDGGRFAHPVSEQSDRYEVAAMPSVSTNTTPLILGDDAILLNGVKLDLLAAACFDVGPEPLGREKIGCGQDQIDNPWRYDPMSPLNDFGTDRNNAHAQPDGTYHYHGNPMAMFESDCETSGTVSPVIGFAADGFPIYGSCFDDDGTVREARSSYVLKDGGGPRQSVDGYNTPTAGHGAVASSNYDGQFRGDYEYSADSGDLDECNGMVVDVQYGYYVTGEFPWVLGCFSCVPDPSFYRLRP